ncbi:MAG: ribosome biogenesis GTPase Der [Alphaproteobacteria bacterium]|jgi:GTP-binding protein|nr:ribosome biogenesis GTPase Der [Alphaproteobacteria bacterium]
MTCTVAIVGRPNVGKSTLFNRLVGRRLALVDDRPGVTRDRRMGEGRLAGRAFTVIDTAGYEEAPVETLSGQMRKQTERAVADADLVLMLVDARTGIVPLDRQFADVLRRSGKPVVLVANKAEGKAGLAGAYEAFELGLGDPVAISAEHAEGLADLYAAILPSLDAADRRAAEAAEAAAAEAAEAGESEDDGRPIQLAIIGRPNVGKSTLVNALLAEERMLTGPEPGVTRDAIAVDWLWRDRPIRLVDTAGLRRRARIDEALEKIAAADAIRAIRLAQVVVLVVEADAILERQDLTLARLVLDEGRALVVAVNKWDTVADHRAALKRLNDRLEASLPQARGLPTVTVSALTGQRLDRLMDTVLEIYRVWTRRVGTGRLNRWLATLTEAHQPPMVKGRRLKLRYITQTGARPPTFALWINRPEDLPDAYRRYLVNGLRDTFELPGAPIRLMLRKGENPYEDKS